MAFDPAEHPRAGAGRFAEKVQSAPETSLDEKKPLTDEIADYLRRYADAQEAYSEVAESGDLVASDEAYEYWEDFQTDNSGDAYAMLEAAKAEIERLQAALAKAEARHTVPEVLRARIESDYETGDDEPTLYVPEDGHSGDGFIDVVAFVDGQAASKYTLDPEGEITGYACT